MLKTIKDYLRNNTKYGKSRYLNFLYQYDLKNYMEYSCLNENSQEQVATKIRILIHAIEKGMSLPNCKAGFGKEKIRTLMQLNEKYQSFESKKDGELSLLVRSIIASYIEFQKENGVEIDFIPKEYIGGDETLTGVMCIKVDSKTDFEQIAKHRHSSRSFSDKPVSRETIEKVVHLAQTAPSACNRQATRIYACVEQNKKQAIMNMHGGVRGFDMPGVIYVITGDLNLYQNEYERNTVFVDGGIFLMNLLYAIDSYGMASCPVIWGSEPASDKVLSKLLGIPESEKIVSLVLSGFYPEETYIAAKSPKRTLDSILNVVE